MKRLWRRVRTAWRVLWHSGQIETEMQEEMRFHLEMEADRLMHAQGLGAEEARRQAHVRFGGVEKYKEEGRDARGRQWLDAISLDSRLGIRMLVKHRGLTLVGGFAMAVAIAIGATFFEVIGELLEPALPVPEGERVVAIEYARPEGRVLHDFAAWRDELQSIEQLGAFRTAQSNLVSEDAPPEPIKIAEMTASGFAVARTPPLLGRYLLPDDERESAAPVVVIGHQVWQLRFAADPQIVGRTLNLGGVTHTVVGVMPGGFQFPYNHHFWIPLRANPLVLEPLDGPTFYLFGRLARGITFQEAQAELTIIGQRAAEAHPETHARFRPQVLLYTRAHVLGQPTMVWLLRIAQLLVGALSFVVAVNLAILVYARTMTRLGEIAVRTALGASRRRILAQLFIESFALSLVGAAAGLTIADMALGRIQTMVDAEGGAPFWIRFDLSPATAAYALALAVVAALIMGVLPGLKATGRRLTANLHDVNGRAGARLGPMWSTLVVAQIAVAVAVLPAAVYLAWQVVQVEVAGPGFAAEEFVVGSLVLSDQPTPVDADRVRRRQLELMSRLESEPGVAAVTFSSNVPGFAGGRDIQIDQDTHEISALDVAPELFDVYDAAIVAGRRFSSGDVGAANAVIVNEAFAQTLLANRNPLGARFRYSRPAAQQPGLEPQQDSYQIIGVVRDFPRFPRPMSVDREPVVYHPAAPGGIHPVMLSVRFSGTIPAGFTDRMRVIGAEVDPAAQLRRVVPLSQFYNDLRSVWRYVAWGLGLVTMSVLLLSAAGIYALMSFTVAQRTREIGVRVALGAHPRRLLLSIFGRVLRQLALGVLVGSLISGGVFSSAGLSMDVAASLLLAVAAIMLAVGVVAAIGPARRGLRIQASEALRTDG